MTRTLEKKLQREILRVKDTISYIARKAEFRSSPSPSIGFAKIDGPRYNGKELLLPLSYSQGHEIDRAFARGKAAGLVVLYHQNECLQRILEKGGLNSKNLGENEFAKYCFWSHLVMTYAGLANMMHAHGVHSANQRAEVCRRAIREAEENWNLQMRQQKEGVRVDFFDADKAEYAALVGINYAAQLFRRHQDQWLAGVLEMHRLHEIHELVTVNENFDRFVAKNWD